MVPLNVHNILDYVIGAVLVVSPFVFGFSDVDVARNLFMVLGFGMIAYSLVTDYRYSIAKIIPVGPHMALDVIVGVMLILGPYVMDYRDSISGGQTFLHYLLGIGAFALVALTRIRPEENRLLSSPIDDSTDADLRSRDRAA